MAILPNIELTKKELISLMVAETSLYGGEGIISKEPHKKEVRKLFYYPLSGTTEELEKFYYRMDNKQKKLTELFQKKIENDIIPIRTISYKDSIVGYDMTSPNLKKIKHYDIIKLQKLKEKIKQFHAQGIVHGDIKESNILVNSQGEIVLCDLDNMQVDEYPIDYFNYMIEYFPNENKLVDQNADIYLYNLLFLKKLFYPEKEYDEVAEELTYEKFPPELKKESREELYKMQSSFVNYQGKYLIDTYIKRKNR